MPYKAIKREDEFCVFKLDEDEQPEGVPLGCHETQDKAHAQVAALYAAEEAEVAEAATLKKQAQRLLRDADVLMSNKKLPPGVGAAIKGLRSALKKTWADLAIDADGATETAEEEEEDKDTQIDVAKEIAASVKLVQEAAERIATLLAGKDGEAAPKPEQIVEVALGESDVGSVLAIHESEDVEGQRDPLQIDVVIIKPGWGNERDNHYYTKELLEGHASAFNGAKMYATNHNPDEKNVLTEVSQVLECPAAFTEEGAPIARVGVFDEGFAASIRNRAALGKLNDLNVSILAGGKARPITIDGKEGKEVIEIDPKGACIDWVTRAGAGGHALRITEGDAPMTDNGKPADAKGEADKVKEDGAGEVEIEEKDPKPEPTALAEAEILAALGETELPDASQERLAKGEYASQDALAAAITDEAAYVAELTSAGQPVAQNLAQAAKVEEKPLKERLDARYTAIEKDYGLVREVKSGGN